MTWNECREWAAETMQRTFDGKRWKFANAAQNIAEKVYLEGVTAGYEVAQRIINAENSVLYEVFPDVDFDGFTEPDIVVLNTYTGREAMRAFEAYDAEKADPINADDGLYVLLVRFAGGGDYFSITTGTKDHCEEYKTSFENDGSCGNGWNYIVAKIEEGF